MVDRRSFLRLVRNRVAAGVLCSGMLTDALEITGTHYHTTIADDLLDALTYTQSMYPLGFKVTKELIEDDFYNTVLAIEKSFSDSRVSITDGL